MSLATYRHKRDFAQTPEPRGRARRGARRLAFVVQRHAASHLHYDFRLELDGVLKSWAVPKEPHPVPGEKRLAVQVEDHPLEYGSFHGRIPDGHYGAGTVAIWDRGWWEPVADPHAGYRKGSLEFVLHGRKLRGAWALVRMRPREARVRPGDKKASWLLIKERDVPAPARPRGR
ncbi:MAG TPA: DNA polymerase ligase N-terminal domain-containing protein [Candidatus Dormibacteraeota bacterium]|nr:DNA polymerase ligase N-terminal domain-containing protein [Candidatus Dormibacteraeota bacterium]